VEPLLALVGPTASGKTAVGIEVARRLDAEVVSVDSMLVYRGMDVGTAKPTLDERRGVAHHLIDLIDPAEPFSVARFQALGRAVIDDVAARRRRPLLVGGSGLYFRALADELAFPTTDSSTRRALEVEASVVGAGRLHARLAGFDPAAASRIEPGNARRTIRALEVPAVTGRRFSSFAHAWDRFDARRVRAVGLAPTGDVGGRIEFRVARMLDAGFLAEVERLLARGFGGWLTSTQAIGYAEMARHLRGRISLDEAVDGTVKRTKALARRQIAWFRRDPRIRWIGVQRGGASVVDDVVRTLEAA
jgi:tRNA dimethylallyltransferase